MYQQSFFSFYSPRYLSYLLCVPSQLDIVRSESGEEKLKLKANTVETRENASNVFSDLKRPGYSLFPLPQIDPPTNQLYVMYPSLPIMVIHFQTDIRACRARKDYENQTIGYWGKGGDRE